jgi:hypothetical protein
MSASATFLKWVIRISRCHRYVFSLQLPCSQGVGLPKTPGMFGDSLSPCDLGYVRAAVTCSRSSVSSTGSHLWMGQGWPCSQSEGQSRGGEQQGSAEPGHSVPLLPFVLQLPRPGPLPSFPSLPVPHHCLLPHFSSTPAELCLHSSPSTCLRPGLLCLSALVMYVLPASGPHDGLVST